MKRATELAVDGGLVFGGSLAATMLSGQVASLYERRTNKPFNGFFSAGVKIAAGVFVGEFLGKGSARRYLKPLALGMIASAAGDVYAQLRRSNQPRQASGEVAGFEDDLPGLDGFEDDLPGLDGFDDESFGLAGPADLGYAMSGPADLGYAK